MNGFVRRYGRGPLVGLGLLLASLVVAGWAAWRFDAVAPLPAESPAASLTLALRIDLEPLSDEIMFATLDKDPFHPDRRRPARRFRLPSERNAAVQAAPRPVGLPANMQLTGTMAFPGGRGTAMFQQGRGSSQMMVRVGEQVGDLTLVEVARGSATFTSPDGSRVVIRVSQPGG